MSGPLDVGHGDAMAGSMEHAALLCLLSSVRLYIYSTCTCTPARRYIYLQGKRANKKLARGEVPPLLLKIDGVIGLETAFAFLKMAPGS